MQKYTCGKEIEITKDFISDLSPNDLIFVDGKHIKSPLGGWEYGDIIHLLEGGMHMVDRVCQDESSVKTSSSAKEPQSCKCSSDGQCETLTRSQVQHALKIASLEDFTNELSRRESISSRKKEIEELKKNIEDAQQVVCDLQDALGKACTDIENYRDQIARCQKEIDDLVNYGHEEAESDPSK